MLGMSMIAGGRPSKAGRFETLKMALSTWQSRPFASMMRSPRRGRNGTSAKNVVAESSPSFEFWLVADYMHQVEPKLILPLEHCGW